MSEGGKVGEARTGEGGTGEGAVYPMIVNVLVSELVG